jgi:hypothetical protein
MVTGDCFYVSEDPRSCIVEQRVDFAEFALDAREGIFDGRKIADVAFETVSIVQFTFNGCEGGSMTRKERGPVTGFNEASRKCCAVSWACARYHGDPLFFHFAFPIPHSPHPLLPPQKKRGGAIPHRHRLARQQTAAF